MRCALIFVAAGLLAGCASITDGTSQTVIFSLTPKTAQCAASRDGAELGSVTASQNTLTVSKGAKDIVVACKADGYLSKSQRLVSSTQAAGVVGGIFLDLGIVDMLTGAMWKYPSDVSIVLEREGAAPATVAASTSTAAPTASKPTPLGPVPVTTPPPSAEVAKAVPVVASANVGRELFQVERMAKDAACNDQPNAALTAKGPGFESYTVKCASGDAMMIRCEMGSCRELK